MYMYSLSFVTFILRKKNSPLKVTLATTERYIIIQLLNLYCEFTNPHSTSLTDLNYLSDCY